MSLLLRVTVFVEVPTGLCLLLVPGIILALLLGVQHPLAETLLAGRIAGAALLGFGVAIWLTRKHTSKPVQQGLVAGITLYTVAAATLLAYAGIVLKMVGILHWPGFAFHAGFAVWCFMCLLGSSPTE